jgi:hypothetical protein
MLTLLAVAVAWLGVGMILVISKLTEGAPGAAAVGETFIPLTFLFAFIFFIFNGYFGTRSFARHGDNWSLAGVILCIVSAVVSGYFSLPKLTLLLS